MAALSAGFCLLGEGVMACNAIPKLWVSEEPQGELHAFSLMVEMPEGCEGSYEMEMVKEREGNRSATRQRGEIPKIYDQDITLSRVTINARNDVTITARLLLNTGLEIQHTVIAGGGSK